MRCFFAAYHTAEYASEHETLKKKVLALRKKLGDMDNIASQREQFVGYLDIPDSNESRFVEDIRQGVAVEYVSDVPNWAERPFSRESKKEYAGRVMEQHRTG